MWVPPHAVRRTCDTRHDAVGGEAFVNDGAADVGKELGQLAVARGWGQEAGVGAWRKSRCGSGRAARR